AAPDVGAHQSGTSAMKFGVAASPGSAVGGAANTTPTDRPPPPPPPAPPPAGSGVTLSATSLTVGSGVTTQVVTYTTTTQTTVQFIQATMSRYKFGQTNNCDAVATGASCSATV